MNNEKTMGNWFGEVLIVLLAILVVVFTVSLDAAFISRALPQMGWLKWTALAVLDFGILGWTMAFIKNARGITQKGLTLVMIGFDFLGVAIISGVEIMTGGQTLYLVDTQALQAWGIRGLILWVIVNGLALLVYHLTSPKIIQEIKSGMRTDRIIARAETKADRKLDDITEVLADEISENDLESALLKMGLSRTKEEYRSVRTTNGHRQYESESEAATSKNARKGRG